MPEPDLGKGVEINPKLPERIKKWLAEYTWIGVVVFIITSYVALIWRINDMVVSRADVERELEGRIGKLEGIIETLETQKSSVESRQPDYVINNFGSSSSQENQAQQGNTPVPEDVWGK